MRRICALVFVIALACPMVASAAGEIGDPYGVPAGGEIAEPDVAPAGGEIGDRTALRRPT